MSPEPTLPVSQPKRLVSHEQARQAYNHMHGALFNGKSVPCLSIPPQPGDVDMILCDYIDQQAERDRELQQAREATAQAKRDAVDVDMELSEQRDKRYAAESSLSEAREEIARLKEAFTCGCENCRILRSALHPVPEKPKS